MLKKEIIWREILFQFLEKKNNKFQQKQVAEKFKFSLSTVSNALKVPRKVGAVKVTGRFFTLENVEKMLMVWATFRKLDKDIIFKTFSEHSPKEIEKLMPNEVVYGAYTAFLKNFNEAPADYDKVYVYCSEKDLPELKKRFPLNRREPNLFVLKADKFLNLYGKTTCLAQTFVDIWNLKDWYSRDYCEALKKKLNGVLA